MQKNIFVDLNVIVDVLLERKDYESTLQIFESAENKVVKLFISGHFVTTLVYLLERAGVSKTEIDMHIEWLMKLFSIVPVDKALLKAAMDSAIKDYEDAVVEQAALFCRSTVIITRNVKDFKESSVKAVLPENYIKST